MRYNIMLISYIAAIIASLNISFNCVNNININDHLYPECGVIMQAPDDNVITFTCQNGNMFSFYCECDNWQPGDLVTCIMYDNNTETVQDDIIINHPRYSGYINGDTVKTWIK